MGILGLVIVAMLELFLILMQHKQIKEFNRRAVAADVEIFNLFVQVGRALALIDKEIKELKEDN